VNTNIITRLTVALVATVLSAGLAACSEDAPVKDTNENRGDTEATTPAPADLPDAGAVAANFMEAAHAYDLDRATGMLADDVEIVGYSDVNEWREEQPWNKAVGFNLADLSCREGETQSASTAVHCSYALHGLGSEELGRGPYGGGTADLTVLDGKITRVEENWPFGGNGFSDEMWEPFQAWVAQYHPDAARIMYGDNPNQTAAEHEAELRLCGKEHRRLCRRPAVIAKARLHHHEDGLGADGEFHRGVNDPVELRQRHDPPQSADMTLVSTSGSNAKRSPTLTFRTPSSGFGFVRGQRSPRLTTRRLRGAWREPRRKLTNVLRTADSATSWPLIQRV
jgi:hypothetical protein